MSKLTYEEYVKASEAGMISGHACACMGPQRGEEFCPCSMSLLNMLTPDGSEKMANEWREDEKAREAKWEEFLDTLRGPKISPKLKSKLDIVREKRLARMKDLGYATESN